MLGLACGGAALFYAIGIILSDSLSASMWCACQPMITLAFSLIFKREIATKLKLVGIALVVGGVVAQTMITYNKLKQSKTEDNNSAILYLMGQVFYFIYCSGFTWYLFLLKEVAHVGYSTVVITCFRF
eukprot:UN02541